MEDKYLITSHKLIWHLDRLKAWYDGERIAPLHIELGISRHCNAKCKFCYWTYSGLKPHNMPYDTMKKLFDDANAIGVKSITFMGEGENTLNPHFYDIVNYAQEVGVDVGLGTNGIALKRDKLLDMLKGLVWIRFSVNASNSELYSAVNGVDAFDTVTDNIRECVRLKKQHNLPVAIGIQMVLIRDNFDDVVDFAQYGINLGVDYVSIKPCSESVDRDFDVPYADYVNNKEKLEIAEGMSTANTDIVVKWNKLCNWGKNPFGVCYGTPFIISISSEGYVTPCPHLMAYDRENFIIGNINDIRLRDMVKTDEYWEAHMRVRDIDVNQCETNCLHHYINTFLWELKHPPEHINFV